MLSQAKETKHALLEEHRRPAPSPHGDAALVALQRAQNRRDVLIRLGGAAVMCSQAKETVTALLEEHRRMMTPRTSRARSPRHSPPRSQPRSPPCSDAGPSGTPGAASSALVVDEVGFGVPALPRPRPGRRARRARNFRTKSPRRSPPRAPPRSPPRSAAGPSATPGALGFRV